MVAKARFFAKVLVVLISLTLIFPANIVLAAGEAAKTRIMHEPPDNYIPGFRIMLNSDIKDEAGIKDARCYFKAKDEKDFIFVDMQKTEGNAFEAILPAPALGSRAINYFFLSLNGSKKVARSQVFEIVEQDTGEAKELKDAEQAKAKGKDVDLDNLKDRLMEKLEKESKKNLKKHQLAKKEGTIQAKTDASEAPDKVKGFKDSIQVAAVAEALRYSMMKDATTVSAAKGGGGLGWVIGGLAVIAGGAALAGGGGGGGSSSGAAPLPPGGGAQLGGIVVTPNGPGSQGAPTIMQIFTNNAVQVPLNVTYNGANLGNYAGTGVGDFPITLQQGATGRLTLLQNVAGGNITVHFRTGGGPAVVPVTGNTNDFIVFRTD